MPPDPRWSFNNSEAEILAVHWIHRNVLYIYSNVTKVVPLFFCHCYTTTWVPSLVSCVWCVKIASILRVKIGLDGLQWSTNLNWLCQWNNRLLHSPSLVVVVRLSMGHDTWPPIFTSQASLFPDWLVRIYVRMASCATDCWLGGIFTVL